MKLTEISIKRPLFLLMVILSLIVFGVISYTRMGADLLPNINVPMVTITTMYPGAGPDDVESKITKPVEAAIISVANVDHVNSTSAEGISNVTIQFTDAANPDMAAIDVERKVNAIRSALPQDALAPSVSKLDLSAMPVMNVSLTGARPMDQLFRYADEKIRPRLETIEGVASVQLIGGLERELVVRVDEAKLKARGLSILQVNSALSQQNISMPSGNVSDSGKEINVRFSGLVQDPKELEDLVVISSSAGLVRLRDVATVEDTFKNITRLSRTNGKESVGVSITKQPTANTMKVAENVRKALTDLRRTMPQDIQITIISDSSTFVQSSLDSVQRSLLEAILLTGLVLLVFLHTLRSTVIVLFSIPTSLVATFTVMYLMGFSLNMMSTFALVLSVGILVDDSIVVLENIYRHLNLGKTPWTAALEGRSEIGLAAIAITLVDVVVYAPVALMSGMVGSMFRQFGLTVAIATLFSLFISFTLTPMLASRWLKAGQETHQNGWWSAFSRKWENAFERLKSRYGSLLGWALGHRVIVLVFAAIVFISSLALVPLGLIPQEYLPATDQGQFTVSLEMPAGTSLDITNARVTQVEAILAGIHEVSKYQTSVGGGRAAQSRSGSITVQLISKSERRKSTAEVIAEVRRETASMTDTTIRISEASMAAGGGGQALSISVTGEDPATIIGLSKQVQSIVEKTPGTKDVTNNSTAGSPEVLVRIDHQKAADLGLTANQVASVLRTGFEGTVATQFRPEGRNEVAVRVLMKDFKNRDVSLIESIPLLNNRGAQVRLGQVAKIEETKGPSQISRQDRQRVVTVSAALAGRPLGTVSAEIMGGIGKISVPEGYKISLGGQTSGMNDAFSGLLMALGLSLLLMYMLMVALFESLIYPLIIMFSIPVSVVGALIALLITRDPLSMVSLMGFIMLTGLVAKNGILLVDYTNTLRERGIERSRAIKEAGPTRLRPIVMTTMAMVAAMMPGAMRLGEGSELGAPMAVVVIGGLLSSMFLTLVLVPVVYTVFDDFQNWVISLFRRLAKTRESKLATTLD